VVCAASVSTCGVIRTFTTRAVTRPADHYTLTAPALCAEKRTARKEWRKEEGGGKKKKKREKKKKSGINKPRPGFAIAKTE